MLLFCVGQRMVNLTEQPLRGLAQLKLNNTPE